MLLTGELGIGLNTMEVVTSLYTLTWLIHAWMCALYYIVHCFEIMYVLLVLGERQLFPWMGLGRSSACTLGVCVAYEVS